MNKIILVSVLVILFLGYALFARGGIQGLYAPITENKQGQVPPTQILYSQTPSTSVVSSAIFKDGNYLGDSADALYGTVQVQAVIKNGVVSDVQFLSYPNTHGTSIMINSYAMPTLTQEAIQAQSSNVDVVSGATLTSMAFQQSLASALLQAKA